VSGCLFCRIVQRELPATIVAEERDVLAFRDINPQAPTHLLVIPKIHVAQLSDLTESAAPLLSRAVLLANRLAREAGVGESGYRIVINCGPHAGQSVDHMHLHLLGGRAMKWPPG
jgi:histidine triad (HIT) family protein